jgi:hypothetical protein
MSWSTFRTCDICGRSENRYGAAATRYVEVAPGEHLCGVACYLVALAMVAKRWLVAPSENRGT